VWYPHEWMQCVRGMLSASPFSELLRRLLYRSMPRRSIRYHCAAIAKPDAKPDAKSDADTDNGAYDGADNGTDYGADESAVTRSHLGTLYCTTGPPLHAQVQRHVQRADHEHYRLRGGD